MQLVVFDAASPNTNLLRSAETNPVQLGPHLYVTVLVADQVVTPFPGTLSQNTVHGYDIKWGAGLGNSMNNTSPDPGFLSRGNYIVDIKLPTYAFPTFLTLPTARNNLRFLHASCRKAHGPSDDLLPELDYRLRDTDAQHPRPHALFLTGDQIYSDDVADELLYMLLDAENTLMNLQASGNNFRTRELLGAGSDWAVRPGERWRTVNRIGYTGALPEDPDKRASQRSHLLTLGEHYAMYLFAWSDVLWPRPTAGDPGPPISNTKTDLYINIETRQIWMEPELPVAGTHFELIDENETVDGETQKMAPFNTANRKSLAVFAGGLRAVRRGLANIAVYMTPDDHEVTDDWMINAKWCLNVFNPTNTVGLQAHQNAMLAYAMFQGWGNDPAEWTAGTAGEKVRQSAAALGAANPAGGNHVTLRNTLSNSLPSWFRDSHASLAGTSASALGEGRLPRPQELIPALGADAFLRIDWMLAGPGSPPQYEFLSLDTRTQRFYPEGPGSKTQYDFAELLSDYGRERQLRHPSRRRQAGPDGLVIVISGGPLLGAPLVEFVQKEFSPAQAPYQIPTEVALQKRFANDTEAWQLAPRGFDRFMRDLIARAPQSGTRPPEQQFLFLSGDVHYGFAARMRYFDRTPSGPVDAVAVQVNSSALKNEAGGTIVLHYLGFIDAKDLALAAYDTSLVAFRGKPTPLSVGITVGSYLLSQTAIEQTLVWATNADNGQDDNGAAPVVKRHDPVDPTELADEWTGYTDAATPRRYRIDYIPGRKDSGHPVPPIQFPNLSPTGLPKREHIEEFKELALTMLDRFAKDAGQNIVGANNMGEVRFGMVRADPTTNTTVPGVIQHLWWRPFRLAGTPNDLASVKVTRIGPGHPRPSTSWTVSLETNVGTYNRRPRDERSGNQDPFT